jgi:hypothetical protein
VPTCGTGLGVTEGITYDPDAGNCSVTAEVPLDGMKVLSPLCKPPTVPLPPASSVLEKERAAVADVAAGTNAATPRVKSAATKVMCPWEFLLLRKLLRTAECSYPV